MWTVVNGKLKNVFILSQVNPKDNAIEHSMDR